MEFKKTFPTPSYGVYHDSLLNIVEEVFDYVNSRDLYILADDIKNRLLSGTVLPMPSEQEEVWVPLYTQFGTLAPAQLKITIRNIEGKYESIFSLQ